MIRSKRKNKCLKFINSDLNVLRRFLTPKIKHFFNRFSSSLYRKCVFLWGATVRGFYRHRIVIKLVILCILVVLLICFVWKSYSDILLAFHLFKNYIISQNKNPQGIVSFSGLFVAIGAAILGVLAITFSLSLFALQQAADKYTHTILSRFLKDRINFSIFCAISAIALLFFVFAIFPLDSFIVYEVILTFIFLLVIFILLRKQYLHITQFINPMYQMIYHHNNAIKGLGKIDKWLNWMIRIGAIRPGRNEENSDA